MKSFQLNPVRVKYSNGEKHAFAALRVLPRDTNEITKLVYDMRNKNAPKHGSDIVRGALESLRRKVVTNREQFRIRKSKQNGPHPIDYWLEAK